jgi:hypothetical protein
MQEELKMNNEEVITMLELLLESVATISSEEEKTTILDNIKPSSFEYVIMSAIDILERGDADDEIHK